jgi:hypothetical protein
MTALGVSSPATLVSAVTFTAWVLHVSRVEQPVRLDTGPAAGRAQFGPSYQRAASWQASFAVITLAARVGTALGAVAALAFLLAVGRR